MRAKRRGFTLIELMIVITIIGILLAFILKAAMSGIRRAEHAATVSLIAKLESALTDRIDALTSQRAEPTPTHRDMAAIWTSAGPKYSEPRAQVIAQYDYLRAELPDVFLFEPSDANYPINFAAARFNPSGAMTSGTEADFNLPIGADGASVAVTGTRGASFASRSAINRQLGYLPAGYDGADNNRNGLIDEVAESGMTRAQITTKLVNHKHKTARAEVLYAILVDGTGPLGSVFNKDDFNHQEVKDTDGDGLLEFVDAWGEPLQFYRWPIMYRSDSQKGFPDLAKITQDTAAGVPVGPYSTVYESRELNPLDSNQQLLSPGWWGSFNAAYPWTSPRRTFASLFHTLVDPLAVTATAPSNTTYWDRSTSVGTGAFAGVYQRRAYYSHFLVLSGGPDKIPGTAQLGVNYKSLDERGAFPLSDGTFARTRDGTGALVPLSAVNMIAIENQGGKIDPNRSVAGGPPLAAGGRNDTNTQLEEYGNDDISNHNLHATGGPLPDPS